MNHIIFLSIIQGVTEFLPISSQAHLIIPSFLFKWVDQGPLFDVAVHVGSLGAILFYLRKDIKSIASDGLHFLRYKKKRPSLELLIKIILASLPAILVGYIIHTLNWEARRSIEIIAYASIGFGILLWLVDKSTITVRKVENLSPLDALWIGIAQCFAFIPGTSRSGATITAARLLGYERREAARFSMLLAIPVILGAGTLSFFKLYEMGDIVLNHTLFIAMAVSFAASLASVVFMMNWLKNASYTIFVVYRVALGVGILYLV